MVLIAGAEMVLGDEDVRFGNVHVTSLVFASKWLQTLGINIKT